MLTRRLNQEVTHWPLTGSDAYGGFTFGEPQLLSGRWEEKQELFITPDNEEVLSMSICYLMDDIDTGDFLAEGDHTTVLDPGTLHGTAYRVRNYSKVTDLRALNALRKAWL